MELIDIEKEARKFATNTAELIYKNRGEYPRGISVEDLRRKTIDDLFKKRYDQLKNGSIKNKTGNYAGQSHNHRYLPSSREVEEGAPLTYRFGEDNIEYYPLNKHIRIYKGFPNSYLLPFIEHVRCLGRLSYFSVDINHAELSKTDSYRLPFKYLFLNNVLKTFNCSLSENSLLTEVQLLDGDDFDRINYSDYEAVEGLSIPHKVEIKSVIRNSIYSTAKYSLSKVQVNKIIPDDYFSLRDFPLCVVQDERFGSSTTYLAKGALPSDEVALRLVSDQKFRESYEKTLKAVSGN
jgi:hypothetical protein